MIARRIEQKLFNKNFLFGLNKKVKAEKKLQQAVQLNPTFLTGMSALSVGGVVSYNSLKVDDNPNCDYVYSLPSFGMMC